MKYLTIYALIFLSACSMTSVQRRPASKGLTTCNEVIHSFVKTDFIDPRLQKLTNQLLETANKGTEESQYHQTLQKLWPQHDLDFILKNPLIYKELIDDFPLMSHKEFIISLRAKHVPEEIIDTMRLVNVLHRGFDGELHPGQIVVHQDAQESTIAIFKLLAEESDFPITSMRPINLYDWSDELSVKMNNSSGFNWRLVGGSDEVSDHAFGSAIDINPYINPWVKGTAEHDRYNLSNIGTLTADSDIVKIFKKHGWAWGGDWENSKDWQHFYRPEIPLNHFGKIEVPE